MSEHNILYRGFPVPDSVLNNLFGALSAFKLGVDTVLDAETPDVLSDVSVYGVAINAVNVDSNYVWLVDGQDLVWYRYSDGDIGAAGMPYLELMNKVDDGYIAFLGHARLELPKEYK